MLSVQLLIPVETSLFCKKKVTSHSSRIRIPNCPELSLMFLSNCNGVLRFAAHCNWRDQGIHNSINIADVTN